MKKISGVQFINFFIENKRPSIWDWSKFNIFLRPDKRIKEAIKIIIILIKLIYLISASLFFILIPFRKNYIKACFLFLRASGRFIGLLNYKPRKYI